jgi:hypothetical protein
VIHPGTIHQQMCEGVINIPKIRARVESAGSKGINIGRGFTTPIDFLV